MPRRKRHIEPGAVYHLISRFVDREFLIDSEEHRRTYIRLLGHSLDRSSWRCVAYAVMSNHIHLAMVAGREPLAAWLRSVHAPFADVVNRSRARIGAVFVRGPKDIFVPDEGIAQLIAYLHNNPVRANVVPHPRQSIWTSHRAYCELEQVPSWLHVAEGMRRAGLTRGQDIEDVIATDPRHPVLGAVESDAHLEQLIDASERALIARERRLARRTIAVERVVSAVARQLRVPASRLTSGRRGPIEVAGRNAVIACGLLLGCPTSELATALHVTPQAVTKAVRTSRAGSDPSRVVQRAMRELRTSAAAPRTHRSSTASASARG
jgi:hypothetical protein